MSPHAKFPAVSLSDMKSIDPKRVKFVLAPAVLVALLVGAWKLSAAFTEFRAELNLNFVRLESAVRDTRVELKREIAEKTADRWTATQMKDWSYQLERANRSPGPLSVPTITAGPTSGRD